MRRPGPTGWLWLALLGAACGETTEDHPMAFFTVDPAFLCVGDGHRTPITLDATLSSARAQLLLAGEQRDDTAPLIRRWTVHHPEVKVRSGDAESKRLTVALPGDRPVQVELEVTRADGDRARATERIGLVRPTPLGPPRSCAEGSPCPACYVCEEGLCAVP